MTASEKYNNGSGQQRPGSAPANAQNGSPIARGASEAHQEAEQSARAQALSPAAADYADSSRGVSCAPEVNVEALQEALRQYEKLNHISNFLQGVSDADKDKTIYPSYSWDTPMDIVIRGD